MTYRNTLWKEQEPVLRNFDEKKITDSISGALALRKEIEQIVDRIWENDFDGIWWTGIGGTWASAMQAEVYMRHRSALPVFVDNAADFITTGNRRFTSQSVMIFSSVSGTTPEMIAAADKVHEAGGTVFAFVDTPGTPLAEKADHLISYPANEQLKFYMTCNYMMYKNGEFDEYEDCCRNMEEYLPEVLAGVEKEADAWARGYAEETVRFLDAHPDMPHYFIASGNQYGAAYSLGMCYWEEQLWIRTRTISAQEFFHGMQEVITRDTPVTLFIGEDEQRPLAERVAAFLPKVCANYVIIDTREFELPGIREEYRASISHLVMRAVCNRIDAYMELYLRHPLTIRRYYRQFPY